MKRVSKNGKHGACALKTLSRRRTITTEAYKQIQEKEKILLRKKTICVFYDLCLYVRDRPYDCHA